MPYADPLKRKEFNKRYELAHRDQQRIYRREYMRKHWRKYAAKNKLWTEANEEKIKRTKAAYRLKNREKILANKREWKKKNRARILDTERKRRARNLESFRKNARDYVRNRRRRDPNFKLAGSLRRYLVGLLKKCSAKKQASAIVLLGCTIENFRVYLESDFEPGMTWENHGTEWEIDHIVPCALFDLTKPEHQKRCFHFSNMQPLWKAIHKTKGTKLFYESGFLPL